MAAALLAVPLMALAAPVPGLAEARHVERYAGQVALAAEVLASSAAGVAASGRLHSLQRLADRQRELERSVSDLERAVEALERSLGTPPGEPVDAP
jgi:uncharacterized protein YceH (UPF0502 family)